jgi:hypothetical protein
MVYRRRRPRTIRRKRIVLSPWEQFLSMFGLGPTVPPPVGHRRRSHRRRRRSRRLP